MTYTFVQFLILQMYMINGTGIFRIYAPYFTGGNTATGIRINYDSTKFLGIQTVRAVECWFNTTASYSTNVTATLVSRYHTGETNAHFLLYE